MKMNRVLGVVLVVTAGLMSMGCGGSSVTEANPCATPNSTYVEHWEETSGNCGPVPDSVVNINANSTLTSSVKVTCAEVSQDGCTARDTDCTFSNQGFDFSMTFETTFSDDGSTAHGVVTLTGSGNGQNCQSTYSTSLVRQ